MRRVIYVLVACVVVLAVAWVLAGLPGRVTAEFGATTVEMATPVAALGLLLLFVVLYAVLRLIGAILRMPGIAARWDAERDRRRGDAAVGRALVALGGRRQGRMRGGRLAAPAGGWGTRRRRCCWRPRPVGWPGATTRRRTPSAGWPTGRMPLSSAIAG